LPDQIHREVILLGWESEENLGLRYIAAYLQENGVSVEIVPIDGFESRAISEKIKKATPVIVGFSMIYQRMLSDFRELIASLRDDGIECHFTMGGHFPTLEYERTLRCIPGLDSIIRHEGELTLLELYRHLRDRKYWPEIKGLVYRRGDEANQIPEKTEIHVCDPRPLVRDLDVLPFPLRNGPVRRHRGLKVSSMIASRGCHYDCSFCSIQEFYRGSPGPKRRSRSPENVVGEMRSLFDSGTRIFVFKDDDFGMKSLFQKAWIERFASSLEKVGLAEEILWRISCRVDEIDADSLRLLKSAGLGFLYLGIESGSNESLNTCNKHYTVDKIYESLKVIEDVGIDFEYGFMMFDPYSSLQSIKENIEFLRELCKGGRATVHFTKMFPYVGTRIADDLKREGRLKGHFSIPDYSYLDSRVDQLQTFFNTRFYNVLYDDRGLMSRLSFALLDSVVVERFFSEVFDGHRYYAEAARLTDWFNCSMLDAMELARGFMECRSREEIWRDWPLLEEMVSDKVSIHCSIAQELENLIPGDSLSFENWNERILL